MRHYLALVLFAFFCACLASPTLRIGILYSDPYADGWTLRHDMARGNLEKHFLTLGYDVQTEVCVKCPVNESTQKMVDWADRGFDIIFSTSGLFAPNVREFVNLTTPNVTKLVTWGSPSTVPWHINIVSKPYQGYYLAGIACGLVTKTNQIGFVALQSTNNLPNIINSFFVGARKVNPRAQLSYTFTNAYYDPLLERRAGEKLADDHSVDCLLGTLDSSRAFAERGLPSVGYNIDLRLEIGDYVLTSMIPDWRSVYINLTMGALGLAPWTSGSLFGEFGQTLEIADFSPTLTPRVRTAIWHNRLNVMNGTDRIFCGKWAKAARPDIYGNVTGNPPESTCLLHSQISSMTHIIDAINPLRNYTFDDVVENVFVRASDPLGTAIYIVASILVVLAFLVLVDIVIYRDTTVYRPASPLFCIMVVVGCIFGYASVFSWVDEPTFAICQLRIWLVGIGFVVAYGGIVVKNYRIWRIFGNQSLAVFAVTNKDLILKGILPLLSIEIIILIIWVTVDPFIPTQTESPLLEYYQFNKGCASVGSWPVAIFITYNALLLVAGALVSFLTSKLLSSRLSRSSQDDSTFKSTTNHTSNHSDKSAWTLRYRFVESKYIGLAIYTTVLVGFCALAVLLAVSYVLEVSVGVISFTVLIFFTAILGFVFGPKIKRTHINGEKSIYTHNQASTTKSTTMKTNV